MSKGTFLYLCEEIQSTIERQDTERLYQPRSVLLSLCGFWLLVLISGPLLTSLECQSPPFPLVVRDVSSAIFQLLPLYIHFPTGDALKEVVAGFKTEYGFPQCAGAINGSHNIPFVSPNECPTDYYNCKR